MSKSDLLPIEKAVKNNLEHIFSDHRDISLVVGVSGGVDSMCLLHILHKFGIHLHVVHIDYQKRGVQSDKDATMVEQTAKKLEADWEVVTVDPEEAAGKNFQQWAREVRYSAFEVKLEAVAADAIATAHHKNDQIETIIQKLFRGSGLASWSGMKIWDGRLFRPLLNANREEIEAYCREQQVPFRTDETNLKSDYARNFLRNEWLHEMQQHFPGWQANILRLAEQAKIFEASMTYILNDISDGKDRIYREAFLQLDEGLQKSVLIQYMQRVDASLEISRPALKELSKLGALETGKSIKFTPHMELICDRDYFKLVVDSGHAGQLYTLEKAQLKEAGFSFNGLEFKMQPYENPDFEQALYVDMDSLLWPVRLRSWKDGDRFQPLGMDGHQSVADHLTNRKISATEKRKALVLESFEETICAVIFPPIENRQPPGTISELVKCDALTRNCLTINSIS